MNRTKYKNISNRLSALLKNKKTPAKVGLLFCFLLRTDKKGILLNY